MSKLTRRQFLSLTIKGAIASVLIGCRSSRPVPPSVQEEDPFPAPQPDGYYLVENEQTHNFGVWRLTSDPTVRDEGNYMNIQCWSPNGRYTCYTRWRGGPDKKKEAEVHVVDLTMGEDRKLGKGCFHPRWANQHNWLFYTRIGTDKQLEVIRYNADQGDTRVIAEGVEYLAGVDASDRWLYGSQRFRGEEPEYVQVRMRTNGRAFEVIDQIPDHRVVPNPVYPVLKVRHKEKEQPIFGSHRLLYDLDGSKERIGVILAEEGHTSWRGDGEYLLMGNQQIGGRSWRKPYERDHEIMANGEIGDICPCGKSGRYICGSELVIADCRSGDAWQAIISHSKIIYPRKDEPKRDLSQFHDIDPKGSPDGTKVHYHSTYELADAVMAQIIAYDRENQPESVHVTSTAGFPDVGDFVYQDEVIGYAKKTETTFEQLTRQKYDTVHRGKLDHGRLIHPLSVFQLSEEEIARSQPSNAMLDLIDDDLKHPLAYQRQTDCYIVVTRLPYPPHLRIVGDEVELIPGESHYEIRGYRLLRNGEALNRGDLISPEESFTLPEAGIYTAIAVEWSRLESPPSLELIIERPIKGRVLTETPADFSWTYEIWMVGGEDVSPEEAFLAPKATMALMHLHDDLIAWEEWEQGVKTRHDDFNSSGQVTRRLEYHNGYLAHRYYLHRHGWIVSREDFAEDGFKTEYIRYFEPPKEEEEEEHWWYDRGSPIKIEKKGEVIFDDTSSVKHKT